MPNPPPQPSTPEAALEQLRASLKQSRGPSSITQGQFDGNDEALRRIASGQADHLDWIEYTYDLKHSENLQPDLFRWAFPQCLEIWRSEHRGGRNSNFSDMFMEAMCENWADGLLIGRMLGPEQRLLVEQFFTLTWHETAEANATLMPKSDGHQCHRLFCLLNSIACFSHSWSELLSNWRELPTPGYAVSWLQFASCFAFNAHRNPLFEAAADVRSGQAPYLTARDGYSSMFLEKNVQASAAHFQHSELVRTSRDALTTLKGHEDFEFIELIVDLIEDERDLCDRRLSFYVDAAQDPSLSSGLEWYSIE